MSAEKAAHTPGPWIIRHGSIYGTVPERDPEYICEPWGRGHAETQANTHLICAAPDLLALAKRYASECPKCGGTGLRDALGPDGFVTHTVDCAACADIRLVVEKAEGRE